MIRAIVVDDEKPSCDDLARLLEASGMVCLLGCFTEPLAALELLKKNTVDAVFLDIEMPETDGLELAGRILDLQGKIAVVFVTAYNDYAVEAFRLNALDYLMKPAEEDRIRETLNRIIEEKHIPMQANQIQVQCFGKFTVQTELGKVKFRTEKSEELFAFLVDQRGTFVSRNQITDSLWEDFDGERAIIHFNSTLYNVKKALLSHGIKIQIEYDRGNYKLDMTNLDCDYLKFFNAASSAKPVSDENISKYEATAELYGGEYLSGKESFWMQRSRQMLKELYIGLLFRLEEYYRSVNRPDKTIEWMKAGLIKEPLHKELNYRLIKELMATGGRISAAQYYKLYENGYKMTFKQEVDPDFKMLLKSR